MSEKPGLEKRRVIPLEDLAPEPCYFCGEDVDLLAWRTLSGIIDGRAVWACGCQVPDDVKAMQDSLAEFADPER